MFQRILVAIAPYSTSDLVLEKAIELTKTSQAQLMLLHVLSPTDQGYPAPIYPGPTSAYPMLHEDAIRNYAQQWEAYERNGLEYLKSLSEELNQLGVAAEFTQNMGDPGQAICALANTWNADLIIQGRRGHTGVKELFLGSVSNYVLHHAPCSVLTIQGNTKEA